jgi:hypothetical protein
MVKKRAAYRTQIEQASSREDAGRVIAEANKQACCRRRGGKTSICVRSGYPRCSRGQPSDTYWNSKKVGGLDY